MGQKGIIREGDTTTHGGKVLEGVSTFQVHGKSASVIGNMVSCPKCNGVYPIIEGAGNFPVGGKAVAVEGMKTACGAELIASQGSLRVAVLQKVDLPVSEYSGQNKYFPKKATTRQELTYENTMAWLKRAKASEDADYMDSYSYLNYARNGLSLDVNDSNLVAAERYAEGYYGNYGRGLILGQDFLKKFRNIPVGRKLFGKNGSPASDSEFITTWGFMGVADREDYIERYGKEPTKLDPIKIK